MKVSAQFHAPAAVSPEKEPAVKIAYEDAWAQTRSGRCGAEKTLLPCLKSNPRRPARSPSLYRLS
jgi:hypothetical protein